MGRGPDAPNMGVGHVLCRCNTTVHAMHGGSTAPSLRRVPVKPSFLRVTYCVPASSRTLRRRLHDDDATHDAPGEKRVSVRFDSQHTTTQQEVRIVPLHLKVEIYVLIQHFTTAAMFFTSRTHVTPT